MSPVSASKRFTHPLRDMMSMHAMPVCHIETMNSQMLKLHVLMNSFLNEKTTHSQTELDIIRLTTEIYNLLPSSPAKNLLQAGIP